jgi:K+-transporting ATPase KdpF subunit
MTGLPWVYALSGVTALLLLGYLVYALIRAEEF